MPESTAKNTAECDDLLIEAGRADSHYWSDVWRYRELLGFLAWRDIKVRYNQTALGIGWALIQPTINLVVFTLIFGRLAGMPDGGVPYPLLVMAGQLAWQLFSAAFSNSSGSLVANAHLVSKVYFPRLIIPLASVVVALVDFCICLVLFAGLCLWYRHLPDARILVLPFFILLAVATAFGAGLWLTALTVKYRDFRYIVPFLLQVGLFLSPVGFSSTNLPTWRPWFSINPLVGVIDGFRWCLLGGEFYAPGIAVSLGGLALLLSGGLWYFRRTERGFSDSI